MKKLNILISNASLILTDNLPAGEGLVAFEIIKRLAQKGHSLTVFVPDYNIKTNLGNVKIIKLGNFKFFPMPDDFAYFLNFFLFSLLAKIYCLFFINLKKFDIHHYILPFNYFQNYTLTNKKPFIIGPVFLPWILKEDEYGEQKKTKESNFFLNKIKNFILKHLKKFSKTKYLDNINQCDKIILSLNNVSDYFKKININIDNKKTTISPGIDTKIFIPDKNYKFEKNNFKIMFMSYLVKRKGLHYLFEAINILKTKILNIKLIIVGQGPDEKYFKSYAENLGIQDIISYQNNVDFYRTVGLFQKCDVFCSTSLGEPYGLNVLQAMACAKPVIAVNAGGIPEIITNSNKELLVEPKNYKEIADKILYLYNNPELMVKIGKDNRKLCVEKFDWENTINNLENLYNSCIKQ